MNVERKDKQYFSPGRANLRDEDKVAECHKPTLEGLLKVPVIKTKKLLICWLWKLPRYLFLTS